MDAKQFQVVFYGYRLAHPECQVTARQPLAQAVLESANFTSHVYQVNNNCFGMMAPQARQTLALNARGKGYAAYGSVLDCIGDYFLWLEAMGITNDAQLDQLIKSGKYAADKAYYTKVEKGVAALQAQGAYIAPELVLGGALALGALAVGGVAAGIHAATH